MKLTLLDLETKQYDKLNAEMTTLEDDVLQHCDKHTLSDNKSDDFRTFNVTPSSYSNEYEFVLPTGRKVSFENLNSANDCNNHFLEYRTKVTQYTGQINKISSEIFKIFNVNRHNKFEQLQPIDQQLAQLREEQTQIREIINNLKTRVTQEKYLGIATPEDHPKDTADAKIDWPHVIETNATRIGVVAAMFFLVTILVPHYRYNVKMANFYQARYDSLEMLPEKISAEEFDKVVTIMSPNIDFGKSPPTPWEHILDVVKAAKS